MTDPAESIAADRADCAVCAAFLATGAAWSQAALLAVVAALAAALTGSHFGHAPSVLLAILAVGMVERYLAMRVSLDARLFARLARADGLDLAALDASLQRVLSVSPAKSRRAMSARIAGARSLYKMQVAATLLLLALAVLAWLAR